MLAAIECDFSKPLGAPHEAAVNRKFRADFEGWCKITPCLNLYDYMTNYRRYLHPFPNLPTIAGNIRYYRDHGVKILYSEGAGTAHADLSELKTWLIAKLAWNPDRDWEELVREFCRGYYGKAATNVLEYIRAARGEGRGTGRAGLGRRERTSVASSALSAEWRWHDLGEFGPSERGGFEVWVGRPQRGGDGTVEELFINGVEITKVGR